MQRSISSVIIQVKQSIPLANSTDIKVISKETGNFINRKNHVTTYGLNKFLDSLDTGMRVASFNESLTRIVGGQVNARVELWFAGRRVDGRRSVATLM